MRFAILFASLCLSSAVLCCKEGWDPRLPNCDKCGTPSGADCSFYAECLESVRSCEITRSMCTPKCNEYQSIESGLTPTGQQWSTYVRRCLQQAVSDLVLLKYGADFQCSNIDESFVPIHVPCYIDGPVSFCNLPVKDSATVLWHAKDLFWKGYFGQSTSAGVKILASCGMRSFSFAPTIDDDMAMFGGFDKSVASSKSVDSFDFATFEEVLKQTINTIFPGTEVAVLVHIDPDTGLPLCTITFRDSAGRVTELDASTVASIVESAMRALLPESSDISFELNNKVYVGASVAKLDTSGGLLIAGIAVVACSVLTVAGIFFYRRRQVSLEQAPADTDFQELPGK